MKPLLIIAVLLVLSPVAAFSQAEGCPLGLICLTQTQANVAALNARELIATRDKVIVLETSLTEKDKSVAEIRSAAAKNEADLKAALGKTEVELALKTGLLIGSEAEKTRMLAMIEFLVKNQRSKQQGIFNVKIGGN